MAYRKDEPHRTELHALPAGAFAPAPQQPHEGEE